MYVQKWHLVFCMIPSLPHVSVIWLPCREPLGPFPKVSRIIEMPPDFIVVRLKCSVGRSPSLAASTHPMSSGSWVRASRTRASSQSWPSTSPEVHYSGKPCIFPSLYRVYQRFKHALLTWFSKFDLKLNPFFCYWSCSPKSYCSLEKW